MSNETMVTIQGWVAAEPVVRTVNGATVANFRVGCTPRRFHRARQEWFDAPTQWYAVSAWRTLAANCAHSLHKGDPVVVHGRLDHRTYVNSSNVEVVALEIDAVTVGHDLNRGVDSFSKSPSRQAAAASSGGPADPFDGPVPEVEDRPTADATAA